MSRNYFNVTTYKFCKKLYILCIKGILSKRAFWCFLCCYLLSGLNTFPAFGASYQTCLPSVSGQIVSLPIQAGIVLINEVLPFSNHTWSCPGSTSTPGPGDTSWLELYNPQAQSFDLYAAHAIIDSGPGTASMYFPLGSAIAAHGFLPFFTNKNIILPNSKETFIRRLLINQVVIDQVTFPVLGNDQSYARVPDGSSTWQVSNTPTIDSSNDLPTATPTPIRAPKHHPAKKVKSTAKKIPAKTRSISARAGITTPGESGSPAIANGVQPAWSKLQLPGTASSLQATPSSTSVSSSDATASSPPGSNNSADGPRAALFTGLIVAFACVLFWCWRYFIKRRAQKPLA